MRQPSEAEMLEARRTFWRPKRPEVPAQCISCPFRTGNDKEFGDILKKLAIGLNHKRKVGPKTIIAARFRVKMECHEQGDFVCHGTAYEADVTTQRPVTEQRQCVGATEWFRKGGFKGEL